MIEQLDKQLFLFLNSLNNPFFDRLMEIISGRLTWIPLYLAILIYLGIKYKKRFLVILLLIIILVAAGDQLSVLIKNLVQRLRPCHDKTLEGLVHTVNGRCGGLYCFVSSHATNSFSVAVLSLLLVRRKWFGYLIVAWALVVGYSRIYLGVHFPGDVVCGSLLGAAVGWGVYELYRLADRKYLVQSHFFNR